MSDDMADKLKNNMLSQLRLGNAVDNKGALLVCEHTFREVKYNTMFCKRNVTSKASIHEA